MDELLKDFLTESAEQVEAIGAQLVRFEQDPSDARIIANIFRLVHALKGTCGFLNLPRMERIAHRAEALIDHLRDGATPDGDIVALVLAAVDRIKLILAALAEGRGEPSGDDGPLIADLQRAAERAREVKSSQAPAVSSDAVNFGPGPTPPERRIDTVRISVKTLERLTSLVSELVLTRNQLIEVARASAAEKMLTPLQRLSAVTADLQAGVFAARMLPVERLFGNFHRLVRDLSTDLGKKAELVLRGGGAELDRQLIEAVRDPLMHLIRNAVDHGIEPPEERLRLGKPEAGLIQVTASHKAGIVSIEVADDGRGLDVDSIRARALALGLGTREELAARPEAEVLPFVFAPGFTTAAHMSRISGRGVGLDIVRANLEGIGGSVSLMSRSGRGATIVLRIPLTLAILPAFIVTAGGERFALPQHSVEEILELDTGAESALTSVQGAAVLNIAEGPLPVTRLSELTRSRTQPPRPGPAQGLVLKMRTRAQGFALIVDDIVDLQEIVLKPLPAPLQPLNLFSAGAILGDGSVVLVLDGAGISAALGLPKSNAPRIAAPAEPKAAPVRTKVVIFRSGGPGLRALPVSAVAKILPLSPDRVEIVDGACVVRNEGRLIALVRRDRSRVTDLQKSPTALVLQLGEERVGVVADEIVDVAEEEIRIELAGQSCGVAGVAVLRGEPTEILDPACFFEPRVRVARRAATARAPCVLIVEPAGFFRQMIADALARAGFEIIAVGDRAGARAAIERRMFAAALIDLDLAAARQGEFARETRALAANGAFMLIGLAAHAGPASQARARRAGLSGAVGKFDRARLISTLRSAGADEILEIAA